MAVEFNKKLNRYIADIGCTAKELADASGLSAAAISRYRTGERAPDPDGENLHALAEGIAKLSNGQLDMQSVHDELAVAISGIAVDYATFLANLKTLLEATETTNNELARALSFDPSYISRILAGQRRPADMRAFVVGVSQYVANRAAPGSEAASALAHATGIDLDALVDAGGRAEALATWMRCNYQPVQDPLGGFLEKLDNFNLDDFIRSIRFDEIHVPTSPLQLPTTRTYTGLRGMMECELDFLKAAVTSKSSADVIMYSTMPMQDMADDGEFTKKWMLGVAMLLKKGLHLHVIHNIDRPLPEIMLGLEGWIPVYMTGQVTPYYFPEPRDGVFSQLLRVAGTVAQSGEAIVGHHVEGRYVLTKSRDEVRYYRRRAERMLSHAKPLMRILTAADAAEWKSFVMQEAADTGGSWRAIMSTLPLGCIPESTLARMLERAEVAQPLRDQVVGYARRSAESIAALMENGDVSLEVPELESDEFDEHPAMLDLSGMLSELQVPYTYDDYREHRQALLDSMRSWPRCTCSFDRHSAFRNTQITIRKGCYAVVSKTKGPVIHFVIEHPDLVRALERFSAPFAD